MGSIIPTRRSAVIPAIALLVLAVAVVGWLHWRTPDGRPTPETSPDYDDARAQLAGLPVKRWDRVTDFSRYRFGEPWSDDVNVEFGHNGCNTRDDVLRRDLTQLLVRPVTCYAQSGVLIDPYTGESISFVRGPETLRGGPDRSRRLAVGCLVQGRPRLGRAAPPRFRQRSAQSAGRRRKSQLRQGIPRCQRLVAAERGVHCQFVARQVAVKTTYRLWV